MSSRVRSWFGARGVRLGLGVLLASAAGCRMDLDYLEAAGAPPSSDAGSGGSSTAGGTTQGGSAGTASTTEGGAPAEPGGSAGEPSAEAGAGGAPSGPLYEITSEGERVVPGSNTFGIDGLWRKFGANPELLETTFPDGKACVKGKLRGAAGGDFTTFWGGGIELVLHTQPGGSVPLAYDASAQRLAGIKLVIEGPKVPTPIRVKYKAIGSEEHYCRLVPIKSGETVQGLVGESVHNCWAAGGLAINPQQLDSFAIHVQPEGTLDVMIDFCVKQVVVVPQP